MQPWATLCSWPCFEQGTAPDTSEVPSKTNYPVILKHSSFRKGKKKKCWIFVLCWTVEFIFIFSVMWMLSQVASYTHVVVCLSQAVIVFLINSSIFGAVVSKPIVATWHRCICNTCRVQTMLIFVKALNTVILLLWMKISYYNASTIRLLISTYI